MEDVQYPVSLDNPETLPDKVYGAVQEAIMKGRIHPGDRIIEHEMSKILKISRGPIREAMARLERDGFVKRLPRRGIIVEFISETDIIAIYQIRSVLEGLAARLFCKQASAEELDSLDKILKNMEIQLNKTNLERYRKLNMEFHEALVKGSENKRIMEIYNLYRKHIFWFNLASTETWLSLIDSPEISFRDHQRILKALRERDPEKAEDAVRGHIERSLKYIEQCAKRKAHPKNEE